MTPLLAALVVVAIAGGVTATAARDPRAAVLGLLIVFLAAPLIVEPWPTPLAILARVASALLAARLLSIAVRDRAAMSGSPLGWPTMAAAAVVGAVAGLAGQGLAAQGLGGGGTAPVAAIVAGLALLAVGIAPLAVSRDALRLGVGAALVVQAGLLVRLGLTGPPSDGEQLVLALLTIGLGGAVAVVAAAGRVPGGVAGAVATTRGRTTVGGAAASNPHPRTRGSASTGERASTRPRP